MELFSQILDAFLDTLKDCALILPFLFGAFTVIGLLERGAGKKMVNIILAADRVGPLAGGLLGVLPSCGFSAAASNLFGAGLLTTGTLLSVYISTSDEMLAVMVSQRAEPLLILKILAVKAVSGIVFGFLTDGGVRLFFFLRERKLRKAEIAGDEEDGDDLSLDDAANEACSCGCTDGCCAATGSLFGSALKRTVRIILFIFAVSLVINIVFLFVDPAVIGTFMNKYPLPGCIAAALLGLIPNCAVSVALTELYLGGVINASALLCGLMTGAGSGLLVLFRTNPDKKENIVTAALLFVGGLVMGSIAGALFF